jgi:hypothetical protein
MAFSPHSEDWIAPPIYRTHCANTAAAECRSASVPLRIGLRNRWYRPALLQPPIRFYRRYRQLSGTSRAPRPRTLAAIPMAAAGNAMIGLRR